MSLCPSKVGACKEQQLTILEFVASGPDEVHDDGRVDVAHQSEKLFAARSRPSRHCSREDGDRSRQGVSEHHCRTQDVH